MLEMCLERLNVRKGPEQGYTDISLDVWHYGSPSLQGCLALTTRNAGRAIPLLAEKELHLGCAKHREKDKVKTGIRATGCTNTGISKVDLESEQRTGDAGRPRGVVWLSARWSDAAVL